MGVSKPIEMYSIENLESVMLLRDIKLRSNKLGNGLVFHVEEKVENKPEFLPYIYNIPALDIRLNLIRKRDEELYEFGGRYGERAVHGYISYDNNTISTTFTYLNNKEALEINEDIQPISVLQAA